MGVIKDGTISGIIPEMEGFAVHYPGYPSSTSRAVETLGGTEGIRKARSSNSNLELHFRPEDPYSHPAFGQLRPCRYLLLKISKKKGGDTRNAMVSDNTSKSSTINMVNSEPVTCFTESTEKSQQDSGLRDTMSESNERNEAQTEESVEPSNLIADIVARVPEAYHYDGMVDYQHVIAVHADVSRKRKKEWADVMPEFEKGGLIGVDQEDLMTLVPSLFSPKDMPENLVLRPLAALNSKKKREAVMQHRWETNIEDCFALDFSIEEIPKTVNWEKHMPQDSAQWPGLVAISKLFDERPIWPRHSISEHLRLHYNLKIGYHLLKRILFKTAYYFSTGPFRRFWIRKGYDPRIDPESRKYQSIDFRLPPLFRTPGFFSNELKEKWSDLCAFRVFPSKCQTAFQLFELEDDYIQQEITKPPQLTTCSCSAGWFSSNVIESFRRRVAMRFLSVCSKPGGAELLKSAKERFEKSLTVHVFNKQSVVNEEHQRVDKDSSGGEPSEDASKKDSETELVSDKENDALDDYGDGEIEGEEEEEEEEEEEFDEYESLHLDGEDDDFSPQSTYPIGENFSKNYLQELFGNIPSSGLGNSMPQDGDVSDGEYQIFEEDSGDNYSDDDD